MATTHEQLDAMRGLGENWDGYGGARPAEQAIELAQEFVGFLEVILRNGSVDAITLHVNPTRIGGVLVEWEDRAKQHEVEISPEGSFAFLHLSKATGQIQTRTFSPGVRAVVQPDFLHELCQLLAA